MKGMRVQSIIRELRGEKIDIIEYSDDPVVFATHALSPAKVSRITILDALEKHMEVIVDDSQLSLAIGKKGQNVRLAAKLLGWKIDIKSEEEKRQEVESAMAALVAPGAPVSVLLEYGLEEPIVDLLVAADVGTIEKLGGMTPEQLEEIQGIDPDMVSRIMSAVNGYYSQFEDGDENPEPPQPEAAPAPPELSANAEPVEGEPVEGEPLEGEPGPVAETAAPASVEEHFEPGSVEEASEPRPSGSEPGSEPGSGLLETPVHSGTIGDAGSSPTENTAEGTGPEGTTDRER